MDGSGKPEEIAGSEDFLDGLGVSPDGKLLAAAVHEQEHGQLAVKIALFQIGSSKPMRMLGASLYSGKVQFTADGKSLAWSQSENGVDNVWLQPLDGSRGHPITDFKSERIWSFDLSQDGQRLGVLRGYNDSDVVLLQESRP